MNDDREVELIQKYEEIKGKLSKIDAYIDIKGDLFVLRSNNKDKPLQSFHSSLTGIDDFIAGYEYCNGSPIEVKETTNE